MVLSSDGYSDPPGIRVRPVQGLHGIDYLASSPLAKAPSYVFGHVIKMYVAILFAIFDDTYNSSFCNSLLSF